MLLLLLVLLTRFVQHDGCHRTTQDGQQLGLTRRRTLVETAEDSERST
jgi:hypothetical protein